MSESATISQGEAVMALNISNKAFYRLVKAGVLTKIKLPGMAYGKYVRSEVDALVKAGFALVDGKESLVEEFCKTIESKVNS